MRIGLSNVTLHLVEDRPPANATSPGKLPVDLAIPSLVVARDRSGLFSLQSAGESDKKMRFEEPEQLARLWDFRKTGLMFSGRSSPGHGGKSSLMYPS